MEEVIRIAMDEWAKRCLEGCKTAAVDNKARKRMAQTLPFCGFLELTCTGSAFRLVRRASPSKRF